MCVTIFVTPRNIPAMPMTFCYAHFSWAFVSIPPTPLNEAHHGGFYFYAFLRCITEHLKMKLSEIIKKNIESMKDVKVDVNEKYGYLSISNGDDEIFLHGDDFDYFMNGVENLSEVDGITYEEKLLFVAEFYTSVIWSN